MASTVLQVRMDENLKKQCAELYKTLGLSLSEAVKLFLKRSLEEDGLPFSMNREKSLDEKPTFDVEAFFNSL